MHNLNPSQASPPWHNNLQLRGSLLIMKKNILTGANGSEDAHAPGSQWHQRCSLLCFQDCKIAKNSEFMTRGIVKRPGTNARAHAPRNKSYLHRFAGRPGLDCLSIASAASTPCRTVRFRSFFNFVCVSLCPNAVPDGPRDFLSLLSRPAVKPPILSLAPLHGPLFIY